MLVDFVEPWRSLITGFWISAQSLTEWLPVSELIVWNTCSIKQCSELVACHISYYCVVLIICQGGQHRYELWHYLVVKMFDSDEIYSTNLIYWSMTLSICCQSLDNTTNSTLILQSVTTKQEVKNGDRPISKIYGLHSPGKSNLARRRLIVPSNMYENV